MPRSASGGFVREDHEVTHRITSMCRGYDPGIHEECEQFDERIQVKESDDLFSPCIRLVVSRSHTETTRGTSRTNCSVFAPDMQDHDYRHQDGNYVHETCCCMIQSEGIGQRRYRFLPLFRQGK